MDSNKVSELERGDKVKVGVMLGEQRVYEVVAVGDAKRDVLVRLDDRSTSVWVAAEDVHPVRSD